jgi:hypothetical protein
MIRDPDIVYRDEPALTETRARLQPTCRLLLLSGPAAVDYYPKIGFERHPQAWTIPPAGR